MCLQESKNFFASGSRSPVQLQQPTVQPKGCIPGPLSSVGWAKMWVGSSWVLFPQEAEQSHPFEMQASPQKEPQCSSFFHWLKQLQKKQQIQLDSLLEHSRVWAHCMILHQDLASHPPAPSDLIKVGLQMFPSARRQHE